MKHIHSGEPLLVDRYALAQIIIMTIADFSEQLFSWQVGGGGGQGILPPGEGRRFTSRERCCSFRFHCSGGVDSRP